MEHYIFTRFNLPWPNKKDKNGQQILTDEWYKERHDLFKLFYLPGIESQTCKNFKVIIGFDSCYPEHYEQYEDRSVWKDHFVVVHEWPNKWIQKFWQPNQCILTSRIDNDDEILPTFVERVQEEAKRLGPECCIDTWGGVVNITNNQTRPYQTNRPMSPFISVYSGEYDCYSGEHGSIYQKFQKNHVIQETLWKQIIHNRNLCNR